MTAALQLAAALLVTEVVECTVALMWLRSSRGLVPVLLCNSLTNPLMNALLLFITSLWSSAVLYVGCLIFLEVGVVVAEAVLLQQMLDMRRGNSLLFSLLLNTTSYLAGVLLYSVKIIY